MEQKTVSVPESPVMYEIQKWSKFACAPSYSRCPLKHLLGKMLYNLGVILWQLVMLSMGVPQCWYWPLQLEVSTVSCWIRWECLLFPCFFVRYKKVLFVRTVCPPPPESNKAAIFKLMWRSMLNSTSAVMTWDFCVLPVRCSGAICDSTVWRQPSQWSKYTARVKPCDV